MSEKIGDRFIKLGEVLNEDNSSLRDIVDAAYACGLECEIRFSGGHWSDRVIDAMVKEIEITSGTDIEDPEEILP